MKSLRSTGTSTAARTARRSSRLPPKRRCSVSTLIAAAPPAAYAAASVGGVGDVGEVALARAAPLDLGDHARARGAEVRHRVERRVDVGERRPQVGQRRSAASRSARSTRTPATISSSTDMRDSNSTSGRAAASVSRGMKDRRRLGRVRSTRPGDGPAARPEGFDHVSYSEPPPPPPQYGAPVPPQGGVPPKKSGKAIAGLVARHHRRHPVLLGLLHRRASSARPRPARQARRSRASAGQPRARRWRSPSRASSCGIVGIVLVVIY